MNPFKLEMKTPTFQVGDMLKRVWATGEEELLLILEDNIPWHSNSSYRLYSVLCLKNSGTYESFLMTDNEVTITKVI